MNKTTIPILILILLPLSAGYGQKNNSMFSLDSAKQAVLDTALNIQKRADDFIFDGKVSIYEFGDSLVDCETNFKNLWHNWHAGNVTNAEEYEFIDFFLVETLSDSTKYNYYRNYFSGDEPFGSSISKSSNSNGQETHSFIIRPGFRYTEFYDTRTLPESMKPIFSMDFLQEAQSLLKTPFCVDTVELIYYYSFGYKKDTTTDIDPKGFNAFGTSEESSIWTVAAPDSLPQEYFDIFVENRRGIDGLNEDEVRTLLLKDIMVQRIRAQLLFTHQVNIGDKIYAIKFIYHGKTYTNYVVCNPTTKKVVLDFFFSNITIDTKRIK